MDQNLNVAAELGYLDVPDGTVVPFDQLKSLPPRESMILTTGSQGEPTAVLSRISMGDHPFVRIIPGDTVVISATPIPGNEETVGSTIDNLMRRGARVLYPPVVPDIHVSGHASRDELRSLIELLHPDFAMPIHGEYRQMVHYRDLAIETGVPPERVILVDLGDAVEISPAGAKVSDGIPAGAVLVDGLTVGGVDRVVLRDRRHLARDGVVVAAVTLDRETGRVVSGPDVTARGFMADNANGVLDLGEVEYGFVAGKIKDVLSHVIYEQTRLRPMILPVITGI
jgi:ribonuclease J